MSENTPPTSPESLQPIPEENDGTIDVGPTKAIPDDHPVHLTPSDALTQVRGSVTLSSASAPEKVRLLGMLKEVAVLPNFESELYPHLVRYLKQGTDNIADLTATVEMFLKMGSNHVF